MVDKVETTCSFPDSDIVAKTEFFMYPSKGYVELHQSFDGEGKVTRDIISELMLDLEEFKVYLKSLGFNKIYTGAMDADKKMIRYWRMMGFRKLDGFPVAEMDI